MRNYKMKIAYDGTRYKGWQRLATEPNTIQNIIESTISDYIGYPVAIHGSGRTDAGVHAVGQVANIKLSRRLNEEEFCHKINDTLPEDIRIQSVELVKNTFHSRLCAVGKTYCYVIDTRDKPDVFSRKYTYHFPQTLDIDRMRTAAKFLIGTHDYSAFCDKKEEKSGVRTIYQIDIRKQNHKLYLEYSGSGFLNHMVRILTGTLIEIGNYQKNIEDIGVIIASGVRANAGFTAPARGLSLKEVYYSNNNEK